MERKGGFVVALVAMLAGCGGSDSADPVDPGTNTGDTPVPAKLSITTVMGDIDPGSPFPAIEVRVLSTDNRVVETATNAVTLSVVGGSEGAALEGGPTTVSAVAGVARFEGLTLLRSGNAYSLSATSGSLTADTAAGDFDVSFRVTALSSATRYHFCALDLSAAAFCWGSGNDGELGNGVAGALDRPTLVAGGLDFQQISAGWNFTCGVSSGGQGYCWGDDFRETLGNGQGATDVATPTVLTGVPTLQKIDAGVFHACALDVDGAAWCWGATGLVGNGLPGGNGQYTASPVAVASEARFTDLSAGYDGTCAITAEMDLYCWGPINDTTTPTAVLPNVDWRHASVGQHTCLIDIGRNALCAGQNDSGQLGDGTFVDRTNFDSAVAGAQMVFSTVRVGYDHTLAISVSGQVFAWGGGVSDPFEPGVPGTALDVSAAWDASCALTEANEVWCWGTAQQGSLGLGPVTEVLVPTRIEQIN